ncbi:MAG: biopolymer transporter ExbD [Planctomycetes bacterium]|nr:biopolymer transporter ExbD [Planctomycetota bacterium]
MKFKRRKLEAVPPFVGMADIVFNLVLFFLILAKMQDESQIKWEPAQATGAKAVGKPKVSLTIDDAGKVYLNGKQVGLMNMTALVQAELGDSPPGERTVLLKIHKDTLAATFEDLIAKVSEAGGEMVHAVEDEKPQ